MKRLWRVCLIMRNKRSGKAYAGVWVTSATKEEAAIRRVQEHLDLGGVDVIDTVAEAWDIDEDMVAIGPCSRVPEFDEPQKEQPKGDEP